MIKYCGYLNAPLKSPIIYFIISYDVMYIGETQSHPVERWSSHLGLDGSFRKNVKKKGDPELNYLNQPYFFAYSCTSITTDFPEIQWKIVTQAVEHEVHCCVFQFPSKLGKRFNIVSDTTRTAPTRFQNWNFAKQLSLKIVDSLAEVIKS
jgi:hypothetical protein